MRSEVKIKGRIVAEIKENGKVKVLEFPNNVLSSGKKWMANCAIAENSVYISHMIFGDGGVEEDREKEVDPSQSNLFGVTRASTKVIAQINPEVPNEVIFTGVLGFEDGVGHNLNEMALQLSNGELFSMATFAGTSKTDQMEASWSWYVCFV